MDVTKIQQVPKSSSDQLLRKFADSDDEGLATKEFRDVPVKRRRRSLGCRDVDIKCEMAPNCSNSGSTGLVERKSLLSPVNRKVKTGLIRQIGGRTKLRARSLKNKSFLGAIEKTWRKTMEGATKVFIEKQYNRHKRLINDVM